MLGLLPGEVCGFVGAVSCSTLRCGTVGPPSLSPGVLFSEPGAFVKRLGRTAQRRRQALGGLPVTTFCALDEALALGGPALVLGLLSAIFRVPASLPLLDPTKALARAVGLVVVSGLLRLISRALALVRGVFAMVGSSLALICDPVALIRDAVALIRDLVALIRGVLAVVRHPLALVGDVVGDGRLSLVTTALTVTTQRVALALENRIIGRELRFPAPDLHAKSLDLWARRFIGRFGRAAA
jgi:hypothetical protein